MVEGPGPAPHIGAGESEVRGDCVWPMEPPLSTGKSGGGLVMIGGVMVCGTAEGVGERFCARSTSIAKRDGFSAGLIEIPIYPEPEVEEVPSGGDGRGAKDGSEAPALNPSPAGLSSWPEVNSTLVWLRDRLDGPSLKDNDD